MNNFVIANPKRCIGCRTCEAACVVAHSEENILVQSKDKVNFNPCLKVIKTADVSAPIQCRHCENAPCANACPNGSIINKDGVVNITRLYIDTSSEEIPDITIIAQMLSIFQ